MSTGARAAPALPPQDARLTGFLRLALGFYVASTALGLLLRVSTLLPVPGLVFPFGVHAHSHTLYFGWAGLALFTLGFRAVGAAGGAERAALGAIALVSAATLPAFLAGGYGPAGMAVSGASLGVWAGAAGLLWRRLRGRPGVEASFLRASLVYLALALLGAVARVALVVADRVAHVQAPELAALAVFSFLHNFAWFFLLGTAGLVVGAARRQGARFDEARLARVCRGVSLLAWATFPLGAPGGDAGWLGAGARVATAALLVFWGLWVHALVRGARDARPGWRAPLRLLAGWGALQGALSAAGVAGLAGEAVAQRHPAILFLHVLLVGSVTLGLAGPLLDALGRPARRGLALHTAGLAAMVAGLGALSAAGFGLLPGALVGPAVRGGLLLATLSGVPLVLAGVVWGWRAGAVPEALPGGAAAAAR